MEKISVAVHDKRICKCCESYFITSRSNQFFCSRKCKKKFGRLKNEGVLEGAKIMRQGNRFTNDEGYLARITAKSSRFEFIYGNPNDTYLYLMCKDCLGVIKKSKENIKPSRNRVFSCPYCQKIIIDAKEKARQEQRDAYYKHIEEARKIKEEERIKKYTRVCPRCGITFIGGRKYCSKRCADRMADSRKEHIRRMRIKAKSDNISLALLLERDKYICWICKKKVDPNDYCIQSDGTFIAGNNYPSIDHVVALKNGGTHTWNNVRLAHMICNTRKNAKMFYEDKNGQISIFV